MHVCHVYNAPVNRTGAIAIEMIQQVADARSDGNLGFVDADLHGEERTLNCESAALGQYDLEHDQTSISRSPDLSPSWR